MIRVAKYEDAMRTQVEAFLETAPGGNIFQSPGYYEALRLTPRSHARYLVALRDGEIRGCLLCTIEGQNFDPAALLSGILRIKGGPVVSEGDDEAAAALIGELDKLRPRAVFAEIDPVKDMSQLKGSLEAAGFEFRHHLAVTIDLTRSEEEIWQAMHKAKRRNIRKAQKSGLLFKQAETPEEIGHFLSLLDATYDRLGLQRPDHKLLENIIAALPGRALVLNVYDAGKEHIESGQLLIADAEGAGDIASGRLAVIDGHTAYCLYLGFDKAYGKFHPVELSYYETMRLARSLGCKSIDLGGGGDPGKPYGVRDFKLELGAAAEDLGLYFKPLRPRLLKLAKKIYRLTHKS